MGDSSGMESVRMGRRVLLVGIVAVVPGEMGDSSSGMVKDLNGFWVLGEMGLSATTVSRRGSGVPLLLSLVVMWNLASVSMLSVEDVSTLRVVDRGLSTTSSGFVVAGESPVL